jgi:hypothetical protein
MDVAPGAQCYVIGGTTRGAGATAQLQVKRIGDPTYQVVILALHLVHSTNSGLI